MSGSMRFEVQSTGVIYREPSGPQGYYARVVKLSEHEYVCSFAASTENETADMHPVISRSLDGGKTWYQEGPIDKDWSADPVPPYSEAGFISRGFDGEVLCLGPHWEVDPMDPESPLVNPETVGMRQNTMILRRSSDGGRTWSQPVSVSTQVDGPVEAPTGVYATTNRDLLISYSTWPKWTGESTLGHRVLCIRSSDNGRTWSQPSVMFFDPSGRIGVWEARIAELDGGRLMATCWAHDSETDEDTNNGLAFSEDGGASWSNMMQMPVVGQVGWPVSLGGDLILFAYNHRKSPVGVRGMIGRLTDTGCEQLFDAPVFEPQVKTEATISDGNYAVTDFQFGAPSLVPLGANRFMAVYWCVVGGRSGINYTIVEVNQ